MAAVAAHGGDYLRRFVAETEWYNELVLSAVAPGNWWRGLPHPVQSWMRNMVGGYLLYYLSGFLWCFVIYYWKRHAYIPKGPAPHSLPSSLPDAASSCCSRRFVLTRIWVCLARGFAL